MTEQVKNLVPVEKGFPIPDGSPTRKYPWRLMDVGDSFLFPGSVVEAYQQAKITSTRLHPKKFIVRKTPDGFRCWRTE